jgi:hypothetical protein
MRLAAIAAFLCVAILIALAPAASIIYEEAYPHDPAKKEALRQCYNADPAFNRLIAAARAACYNSHHQAVPARRGTPLPPTASRMG